MGENKLQGHLCVAAGTLMHLYLGCVYLWGNVTVYITSYLHKSNESITLDDTSIVFVVQVSAQALCLPIAPFLLLYLPIWACCLIGGVIAIGSVFASSFVTSFPLFVILYGFFFGVGIGFSYMCPIIAGWEYFPTKKGLVSGIVVCGYGFGSFIFGFISLAIANPDGESATLQVAGGKIFEPDNPISSNAPKMIRYNCLFWAILLLIALPFLRRKKTNQSIEVKSAESKRLLDEDSNIIDKGLQQSSSEKSMKIINKDPTVLDGLLSWRSLHIWVLIICSSIFPFYIASNFKSYGSIDISDDTFMTVVGSVGATLNGISRICWATLSDYFGFKKVYISLVIVDIAIAFTFELIHKVKALYFIWVCISYTCLGGHFSLFPFVSAKIFGPKIGGKVYSLLFTSFAVATVVNYLLSRQSSNGNIGYTTLFYILAGMAVIAFILALFFKESPFIKQSTLSSSNQSNSNDHLDINITPETSNAKIK